MNYLTHQQYSRPLFRLGRVVATPGALQAYESNAQQPSKHLRRHQIGDWGTVCDEDKQRNNEAVAHEGQPDRQQRVLSSYELKDGMKVWVITEHDRSVTTILLPEEY